MLLFDIVGTLNVRCHSFGTAAEKICAILVAEGGSNVKILNNAITFDGETGRMSFNRLNNIATGKIELRSATDSIQLTYVVNIDRWSLMVTTGASIFGIFLLMVDGVSIVLLWGIGTLLLTLASTFVIRLRFHRLLKQAFQIMPLSIST
jgi:hypothetical protein